MQRLIDGVHHFQSHVFGGQRQLFQRLGQGQRPQALFITCSDSRVVPSLLTQSEPGTLFELQNAGNFVPAYGADRVGGAAATIEYAVAILGVEDIIICGHSHCGAVTALLSDEPLDEMPALRSWLGQAELTRRVVRESCGHLSHDRAALLEAAVQVNVLAQLDHLRTHPSVAAALSRGAVRLHGWVYQFDRGEVLVHDAREGRFRPLREVHPRTTPPLVA